MRRSYLGRSGVKSPKKPPNPDGNATNPGDIKHTPLSDAHNYTIILYNGVAYCRNTLYIMHYTEATWHGCSCFVNKLDDFIRGNAMAKELKVGVHRGAGDPSSIGT